MNSPERCMCGDPACWSCGPAQGYAHPLEQLDTAAALSDVVETLMLFGQFPQPRHNRTQRILFDLREWIGENIDPAEMIDLYLSTLIDYSTEHDALRMKEAARVEKMLRDELESSKLVSARAEELAEQDRE